MIWLVWAASRAALLFVGLSAFHRDLVHDIRVYAAWSQVIAGGHFPVDDRWQYPPLAAVVMAAPRLLPLAYLPAFILLALLADLLILLVLLRRGDSRTGAWTWTAGLALLGPLAHLRYDLFVTVFAVAALMVLPRQRLFGALAAVGTMLKLWPVLLLMGLPRDRRSFSALTAFAATTLATLACGALFAPGQLGFLQGQQNRGIEIEAVAATPWQAARLLGHPTKIVHQYGCAQFTTLTALAPLCALSTLIGLALVAALALLRPPATWTPAAACDVALAATLVAIVTSRVLSPQYLIWAIGIGAAALAHTNSRQRPTVLAILVAALLTQLVFPIGWQGLTSKHPDHLAVVSLVARNLLLVTSALLAITRLWQPRASQERHSQSRSLSMQSA
ncbi:DUF2029 domain-containing protein [Actinomadura barringtoniae]|uniref:DUF2029 domain-containing protein n=1 Tax=Actinomadura barringtoniae TaxID=1427535 RepID=A0A939PSS3_9ACTN|nr:glycosyltransferase 87 family protein [Actinomadura barringtoniae]MBO2455598.1 DUF2029 domain-containing protein [Actinomadura barringtoniae]